MASSRKREKIEKKINDIEEYTQLNANWYTGISYMHTHYTVHINVSSIYYVRIVFSHQSWCFFLFAPFYLK